MKTSITTFLKNLVQLVCAPARGWEDLAADETHEADACDVVLNSDGQGNALFYRCFLPWIALCSVSSVMKMLYGTMGITWVVQHSLVTFVSLFLAAQCSRYIFLSYMPRLVDDGNQLRRNRWSIMIVYSLSFLGLIVLVSNVVKVRIALIEFMPLYVVFIVWKGWRYAGVAERNVGLFVLMASVALLGSATLIEMLLDAVV